MGNLTNQFASLAYQTSNILFIRTKMIDIWIWIWTKAPPLWPKNCILPAQRKGRTFHSLR